MDLSNEKIAEIVKDAETMRTMVKEFGSLDNTLVLAKLAKELTDAVNAIPFVDIDPAMAKVREVSNKVSKSLES